MPSKKTNPISPTVAVVTFLSLDGACAAALVLLKHPNAQVYPSSAGGIAHTLGTMRRKNCDEIHICGLGIKCALDPLLEALRALKQAGTKVVWYCGYDYLDEFRARLAPFVTCRFTEDPTPIVAAVHGPLFKNRRTPDRAEVILALGTKSDKEYSQQERRLADLVNSSIWRFLNYRDYGAYPHAIRVLAGRESMTDDDERTIASYRRESERILVGKSKSMEQVREYITKCGPSDSTVLITGETGTGKEIVARLIHEASNRSDQPFVAINCATLDGDLQQDMLFGHEKGAYTGASDARAGCFEDASGGTLFLDEIGELTPDSQAKLLRVLQERVFRRLGGNDDIKIDVRVLAATNRDLLEETRAGRFRRDLYYRLAVLKIEIPPLRERKDDIPLLIDDILYRACEARGREAPKITKRQKDILARYPWPGNVRELENVLERLLVLGGRDVAKLLDPSGSADMMLTEQDVIPLAEHEARYIRQVHELTGRNITKTAEALGISRNTLKKRLETTHS